MKIGIDASRAFIKKRTGIEEYSYQVIQHLRDELRDQEVVLYVRKKLTVNKWRLKICTPDVDFPLPLNWRVRGLWAPRLWTQVRLSLEMLFHRPDKLFVPAHTVPWIHPRETIVTIHGLEYEFVPRAYSWVERFYMRFSIRSAVRFTSQVIVVSKNTKKDVMQLYAVPEEKIAVVYEGIDRSLESGDLSKENEQDIPIAPYFLFVGRIEERKNVRKIVEAFEFFKTKTHSTHQLVLVGKPGYGYKQIKKQILSSRYKDDIIERGYVDQDEKWRLLRQAQVFVFPSLYEGFGLPVLEAQLVGTPVITSNSSSLPEIAGEGALFVDPLATRKLARAMATLVSDEAKRADIIDKATRNVGRFSWAQCARGVAQFLKGSSPS